VVGKLETVNVKIDVLSNDISELKKDKEIFVKARHNILKLWSG